jgi:hypothetical protein
MIYLTKGPDSGPGSGPVSVLVSGPESVPEAISVAIVLQTIGPLCHSIIETCVLEGSLIYVRGSSIIA